MKKFAFPLLVFFLAASAFGRSMGDVAPSSSDTNTGVSPQTSSPAMGPENTQRSGILRDRSNVTGQDLPVSETSNYNQAVEQGTNQDDPPDVPSESYETRKSSEGLASSEVFPVGPYKAGEFKPSVGEEKQAEEAQIEENINEQNRVNMGFEPPAGE